MLFWQSVQNLLTWQIHEMLCKFTGVVITTDYFPHRGHTLVARRTIIVSLRYSSKLTICPTVDKATRLAPSGLPGYQPRLQALPRGSWSGTHWA